MSEDVYADPVFRRIVVNERAARIARATCLACGHGKPGHGGRPCFAPSDNPVYPGERCRCAAPASADPVGERYGLKRSA